MNKRGEEEREREGKVKSRREVNREMGTGVWGTGGTGELGYRHNNLMEGAESIRSPEEDEKKRTLGYTSNLYLSELDRQINEQTYG